MLIDQKADDAHAALTSDLSRNVSRVLKVEEFAHPHHHHQHHHTSLSTNHNASAALTVIDRPALEEVLNYGCKTLDDVPSLEMLEAKKRARSLKFAVLYSGQVCHGRGAGVLWHPANMEKLWGNKDEFIHGPLKVRRSTGVSVWWHGRPCSPSVSHSSRHVLPRTGLGQCGYFWPL